MATSVRKWGEVVPADRADLAVLGGEAHQVVHGGLAVLDDADDQHWLLPEVHNLGCVAVRLGRVQGVLDRAPPDLVGAVLGQDAQDLAVRVSEEECGQPRYVVRRERVGDRIEQAAVRGLARLQATAHVPASPADRVHGAVRP